jgi:hypothetical protein
MNDQQIDRVIAKGHLQEMKEHLRLAQASRASHSRRFHAEKAEHHRLWTIHYAYLSRSPK